MKTSTILLAGVLALAPSLRAEAPVLVLSGGLLANQGSTLDLTGKKYGGYTVELGALFSPENFGPRIMAYVGMARIPAADPAPGASTFTMDSPRLGADLVYQPWEKLPITIRTGPSFHIWQVKAKGNSPLASQDDRGVKLGWRAGLGYEVTRNWCVSLYYTFTEWRSDPNQGLETDNPSRPSYLSLMGSYRF